VVFCVPRQAGIISGANVILHVPALSVSIPLQLGRDGLFHGNLV
jgi:hypothetical protein